MSNILEISDDNDPAMNEVAQALYDLDPDGSRWAAVIRRTYDMIYNGQETGRYLWEGLMKTEKTHFGTLFEINAQREFRFDGGDATDFRIAGWQVDAKWSQQSGQWMLPPEVIDEIALVATGNDQAATWSLGLVRVKEVYRSEGSNRDKKSRLNAVGRRSVRWLWSNEPLRPNVLLQLAPDLVSQIFALPHGTQRTNQLFRAAEGLVVQRSVVATVSRQLDAQKRVRYNNGARSALAPEGYLILSGTYHATLATALGLTMPLRDEYISARVVPTNGPDGVLIAGRRWRRAEEGEQITESAPRILDL